MRYACAASAMTSTTPTPTPPVRLHLGCGRDIMPGWVNVDHVALPGVDVIADLDACARTRLPFEDDSVGEIRMSHVLEHMRTRSA